MKARRLLCILILTFTVLNMVKAEYQITGMVHLSPDWQRQIFLSTINKIDDYYKADPSDIIQVGSINEDGSFVLRGDNLPPDPRFYRLYLIKEENTEFDACMYIGGDDHNFIHIILDNNTRLDVQSDQKSYSPFADYTVSGSQPNRLLSSLSELIFPSFYYHKIKFPSELQFTKDKLNRDLFYFADTCQNTLVSLAALINTDMDQYYDTESERYEIFAENLSNELPNHDYTDNFFRKINYHKGSDSTSNSTLPWWAYLIICMLTIALINAWLRIKKLSNRIVSSEKIEQEIIQPKKPILTSQEEKILNFISDGKSNKEIASELFVELSTVKTHINKLYAKLGTKNRNEARQKAKILKNTGV